MKGNAGRSDFSKVEPKVYVFLVPVILLSCYPSMDCTETIMTIPEPNQVQLKTKGLVASSVGGETNLHGLVKIALINISLLHVYAEEVL